MLKLVQACDAGYHFSDAFGGCVLDDPDVVVDVPGSGATASSNFLLYAGIGLGLILLLGAFAGGRASRGSSVTGQRKRVTKSFWVTF